MPKLGTDTYYTPTQIYIVVECQSMTSFMCPATYDPEKYLDISHLLLSVSTSRQVGSERRISSTATRWYTDRPAFSCSPS